VPHWPALAASLALNPHAEWHGLEAEGHLDEDLGRRALGEVLGERVGLVDGRLLALGVVRVDGGRLRVARGLAAELGAARIAVFARAGTTAHGDLGHLDLGRHDRGHEGRDHGDEDGDHEEAEHDC